MRGDDMRDHRLQIFRCATVREAQQPIRLAAASTGIPDYGVPAVLRERADHP